MKGLAIRVLLGLVLGVAVFAALGGLWADLGAVWDYVAAFNWWLFLAALGLACGNYLIRFVKWQYYLRTIEVDVPTGESLTAFLASFVLTVTPAKLGEVLKSVLIRKTRGVPIAVTAPIVLAERLTDLIALLGLALVGVSTYQGGFTALALSAAFVAAGLAVLSIPRASLAIIAFTERIPLVGRVAPKLTTAYGSTRALIAPKPLFFATGISVFAWSLECLGFFVIMHGFVGAVPDLVAGTFVYASTTVLGALSFLPGGLGVTDGSMAVLAQELGMLPDQASAVAATCVIRLATLWFAVLVGFVALGWFRHRYLGGAEVTIDESSTE